MKNIEQAIPWADRVKTFLEKLQWEIRETSLYEQALTHSSYAHEKGDGGVHNERLEFLGDAVLQLAISDYLYFSYPEFPEGRLTRLRADLVCEATLAAIAAELGLGQFLRLGKGEAAGGGAGRPSLLADAVEALFGALFLDQGLEKCRRHILLLYQPVLKNLEKGYLHRDYKTLLQEFVQARHGVTPEYGIVRESGPDHEKVFFAEVLVDRYGSVGKGSGKSKKEAEQAAAKEAWFKLS